MKTKTPIRKILTFIGLVVFATTVWQCSITEESSPQRKDEIKSFLEDFYTHKYNYFDATKKVTLATELKDYYAMDESEKTIALFAERNKAMKAGYKDINLFVTLDSLVQVGESYKTNVNVLVEILDTKSNNITSFIDQYILQLHYVSPGKYKIDSEYQKPEFNIPSDEKVKQMIEEQKIELFFPDSFGANKSQSSQGEKGQRIAAGYYDRNSAIIYAQKYALKDNPSYVKWGNDCTNFTSQCLKMGGWKEVGNILNRTSTASWYYTGTTSYSCYSWSAAHNFLLYMKANNRGYGYTMASAKNNLQVGDIIQIDFKRDGVIDHTMIITKKDNVDTYMSYHTTNTLNKKLSEIFAANAGNSYFYGWNITGTN